MRKIKAQAEQEKQIAEIMDKRVELAAAKELLNLAESEALKQKEDIKFDVNIKVVQGE